MARHLSGSIIAAELCVLFPFAGYRQSNHKPHLMRKDQGVAIVKAYLDPSVYHLRPLAPAPSTVPLFTPTSSRRRSDHLPLGRREPQRTMVCRGFHYFLGNPRTIGVERNKHVGWLLVRLPDKFIMLLANGMASRIPITCMTSSADPRMARRLSTKDTTRQSNFSGFSPHHAKYCLVNPPTDGVTLPMAY